MKKLIDILNEITIKSQSITFRELMDKIDYLYKINTDSIGDKGWIEFVNILNWKYKRREYEGSLDWTDYIYYNLKNRWNELYIDVLKIIKKFEK